MFALIRNNTIQVGPRNWTYGAFKEYLEDNSLDYSSVPTKQPDEDIITQDYSIVKVNLPEVPPHKFTEQLSGPNWSVVDGTVVGSYSVVDRNIEAVKNEMYSITATKRYNEEVAGIDVLLPSLNETVSVYTGRDDRRIYLDAILLLQDGTSVNFKFRDGKFKTVLKSDLEYIVQQIGLHVQSKFNWESTINTAISEAANSEDLEVIMTELTPTERTFGVR